MKTLLVTGGCGFIGRNLIQRLARQGAQVRIPTRVPNGFHANWMQDLKLGN